ncbi:MAG: winged helix-turn-helix transcriptional regulator [Candidatus Hydrogenedentes bacterium]|nr:winged helix-turn-helix transcriptional regulator [Candidatus Hydrogenedentota bacterium]
MRSIVNITKALADENRVRALGALQHQPLCVCQIIELLGLAPSTVSKHLAILRQAGLVTSKKEGRWIYFQRADAPTEVVETLEWLYGQLARSTAHRDDQKKLRLILKQDPAILCQMQHKG